MSKMKMLLDVVRDLYQLGDSLNELARALEGGDTPLQNATPSKTPQDAPYSPSKGSPVQQSKEEEELPWEGAERDGGATGKPDGEQAFAGQKKPAVPALDMVTLRAKIAEYSTPENRPKIKSVLSAFGVKKLTELAEDQYAAVLAEVEKACRK